MWEVVSPELYRGYMSAFLLATCESSHAGMFQSDSLGRVVSILLPYPFRIGIQAESAFAIPSNPAV